MALKEIEYRLEKRMGTETVSSCDKAPVSPGRLRRKSAKAAAALVSAVAKEELTLTLTVKRNYVRSQSAPVKSSSRVASSSSSSSGGGANRSGKKTALSQHAVQYLKNWMLSPDHIEHPYPTEEEKAKIMKETAIDIKQLTNWFVNNRKRYWKPKVEEYQRRSSESKRTLKQIAEEEWMDLDGDADINYIVSDEGEDNEKQQPKKKRQRASVTSKIGGDEGCATISPANSPKPKRSYKGVKGKEGTAPELPVLTSGIFTAKSHASIKAANAMRYVGETETSSSEIDESDELEEDAATIFSSSTEESKVIAAEIVEPEELAYMHLEEMGNVGCGCVADPLSSMISHNGEPCALCAACRDWNDGEFCPWDLTEIIGNIQSEISLDLDLTGIPAPAPAQRTVSGSDIDLDVTMAANPSTSTFETLQDMSNEIWDVGDTW